MTSSSVPPAAATSMAINTVALSVSLLAAWLLLGGAVNLEPLPTLLLIGASYAVPIVVLEGFLLKRGFVGMQKGMQSTPDAGRVLVKLFGLAVTLFLIVGVYSLFPEYRGSFYNQYYAALRALAPWWLLAALPYFYWMDGRSGEERDGYWQMGELALFRWKSLDRRVIGQHLLGWLVKLFFLPLMFVYFAGKVRYFQNYHFELVFTNFKFFYDFAFECLLYIDLLIACVGYLCTLKVTDSHIRSTDPTLLGWGVAIMCYQPFWAFFSAQYLDYQSDAAWGEWLWEYAAVYVVWGSTILVLMGIYVWASLAFGIRFSNLTHRGILTNGPYRYCKHPAYVSKSISWWLISMPFMVGVSIDESLRHCLLLLLLNLVYLLRARTEERHLSQDPAYCVYALYIEEHGIFRRLGRWLPVLKFAPGQLFNLQPR